MCDLTRSNEFAILRNSNAADNIRMALQKHLRVLLLGVVDNYGRAERVNSVDSIGVLDKSAWNCAYCIVLHNTPIY